MQYPAGGAEGVRTPDLLNAIQALYQLSYDPNRSGKEGKVDAKIVKTNFQLMLGPRPRGLHKGRARTPRTASLPACYLEKCL